MSEELISVANGSEAVAFVKPRKRRRVLKRMDQLAGVVFVAPFLFGFIFMFARPMITSLFYTFNRVIVEPGAILFENVGLSNYVRMVRDDLRLRDDMVYELRTKLIGILMIMFFSLFIALLLNDKFPGRLFFRAVLFLPVIFGSKAVLGVIDTKLGIGLGFDQGFGNASFGVDVLRSASGNFDFDAAEMAEFVKRLMDGYGLPEQFKTVFFGVITDVVKLVGASGIQIILFLLGLQSVPSYLYEVSVIEGATKWETFWKITFPLLTPSLLLCLVFTVVNEFNYTANRIVSHIEVQFNMDMSYAMSISWAYSIFIFLLVGLVYFIVGKRVIYLD